MTPLVLAVLMIFSAAGYILDVHYCQGQVKSYSLFGKAKGCNGKGSAVLTCAHQEPSTMADRCAMERLPCCDNRLFHFQSSQDQVIQASTVTPVTQQYHFVPSYAALLRDPTDITTHIQSRYRPPPLLRDIPVLMQTFLL